MPSPRHRTHAKCYIYWVMLEKHFAHVNNSNYLSKRRMNRMEKRNNALPLELVMCHKRKICFRLVWFLDHSSKTFPLSTYQHHCFLQKKKPSNKPVVMHKLLHRPCSRLNRTKLINVVSFCWAYELIQTWSSADRDKNTKKNERKISSTFSWRRMHS